MREFELQKTRALEVAEIEQRQAIELAEQQREIAIAEQSGAVSAARGEAEKARANFVKAEESVISVRDVERAERAGLVEIANARAQAEKAAVARIREAEAEKAAAAHRAESDRLTVDAEVAARKLRAAADQARYAIDAAGKRALYEAENVQTPESVALRTRLAVIERLEGIIRESAKPLERIEGIKIVQLAGVDNAAGSSSASLSDQVVSSALRYRTQAPLVDALLNDLGIPAGGADGLLRFTQDDQDQPPA